MVLVIVQPRLAGHHLRMTPGDSAAQGEQEVLLPRSLGQNAATKEEGWLELESSAQSGGEAAV
jgi:hypothetical protein